MINMIKMMKENIKFDEKYDLKKIHKFDYHLQIMKSFPILHLKIT